jgi:hypothetical protein
VNPAPKKATRYAQIIERVFFDNYWEDEEEVSFDRDEFAAVATDLGIDLPKNLGDVIYSFRYRVALPQAILDTATDGNEWIIEGAGRGRYRFRCVPLANIQPTGRFAETKVPDATPGLIEMYALSDEQALLAKLRYNRLIDVFLGLTCYSLQNHLRTTVPNLGQVETDEVYIGLDTRGAHYIIPVQAKGGSDKLSTVQIAQDFALAEHLFPNLIPLPVAAQFMSDDLIALFSFEQQDGHPAILNEKHYRLAQGGDVTADDLQAYRARPFG